MIIDRYDTRGTPVHGAPFSELGQCYGAVYRDGAIFRLAIDFDGGTRDVRVYLDAEGCVAVAYALLDAAKWALPGGVEGCDDRHVREACEALSDRAVMIEGVDATYDGDEVLT